MGNDQVIIIIIIIIVMAFLTYLYVFRYKLNLNICMFICTHTRIHIPSSDRIGYLKASSKDNVNTIYIHQKRNKIRP